MRNSKLKSDKRKDVFSLLALNDKKRIELNALSELKNHIPKKRERTHIKIGTDTESQKEIDNAELESDS